MWSHPHPPTIVIGWNGISTGYQWDIEMGIATTWCLVVSKAHHSYWDTRIHWWIPAPKKGFFTSYNRDIWYYWLYHPLRWYFSVCLREYKGHTSTGLPTNDRSTGFKWDIPELTAAWQKALFSPFKTGSWDEFCREFRGHQTFAKQAKFLPIFLLFEIQKSTVGE